uniref:Uncharacterized protein n=1 Tax=Anopheles farauti TaxID=69004 RepID=A0A182QN44_9DIPT
MASIRHYAGRARPSVAPLQLLIGGICVLLMLPDYHRHAAEATIPTIDNIVKILQSPVVQQLILPRPLVAADPSVAADVPATMSDMATKDPKMPSQMNDAQATKKPSADKPEQKAARDEIVRPFLIPQKRSLPGCPLCDASVYSYCDEKVYHDACCCGSINGAAPFGGGGGFGGGFGGFGRQGFGGPGGFGGGGCGYQGCSFLFANSCYEHQLIVNCCCNSPY